MQFMGERPGEGVTAGAAQCQPPNLNPIGIPNLPPVCSRLYVISKEAPHRTISSHEILCAD
jgi:hypothetical protein